jgi:hypothetical protein
MSLLVPKNINKYRALAPAAAAPKKNFGIGKNQFSRGQSTSGLNAVIYQNLICKTKDLPG